MSIPVVGIAGWSKSGKTTFLEHLIRELKDRGVRVGTIKHSWHQGLEPDVPGTDTWRHARAGSDVSVLASPGVLATFERVAGEPTLEEALSRVRGVDIVLVEGYKKSRIPKLLLVEDETLEALHADFPGEWLALVCRSGWAAADSPDVPRLPADDVSAAADLLASRFGL